MQINLTPKSITTTFGLMVALLLLAHTIIQVCSFVIEDERLYGLVFMFSVGADGNIPTYYSAFALLFSSGLLAFTGYLIRKAGRPMVLYWFGLSAIFLLMSADEMLELHERLIEPLRATLGTSGAFYYAWVIPYGMAAGAIGGIYLKFLLQQPRRTATGFIVAGVVFITGAIGFEMLGGIIFEQSGSRSASYVVVQTIEEALEMIGIVIFIYAITDYIAGEFDSVTVSLDKTDPSLTRARSITTPKSIDPTPAESSDEWTAVSQVTRLSKKTKSVSGETFRA